MDKFEKFMAKPYELELKTESDEKEVFVLYPLSGRFLPDVFKLFRKFAGVDRKTKGLSDEEKAEIFMNSLDDEAVTILNKLILEMLKKSYPDKKDDVLENFMMSHFMDLFPAFIQLHSFGGVSKDELEKLRKLRQDNTQEAPRG